MRKQQQSTNPNGGGGNYSPIALSSMPMGYPSGISTAASSGPCTSPNTYVLPTQTLPETSYSSSSQSKKFFKVVVPVLVPKIIRF